ncbi:hypothetical protein EST35_0362 [Pseudomonas phage vB_PaeM_PA5oct]|uniref:Uncharacterized protein n=1 Tax=Pseudomonas phage vB_PaeM_PA5oct TaxID=2163605 RepID=A0A4Y5JW81_9CAUD|nr:hypothetical protein PQE65_gp123 [Pseudomonas phage vB_PaeM_PA5oct]QCG76242.1 hypothetical protein EST35_0362 [Pseudomonas phage vB_PaeM_PA5oct]
MNSIIIKTKKDLLYETTLSNLGFITTTIQVGDIVEFDKIEEELNSKDFFTAFVRTSTHFQYEIAKRCASRCKIVFIDINGFRSAQEWEDIKKEFPYTRFILLKNNMWNSNISDFKKLIPDTKAINIKCLNKNKLNSLDYWNTIKGFSFGGTSRDILPHLLSIFVSLNDDFAESVATETILKRNLSLSDIKKYIPGPGLSYDVDDYFNVSYQSKIICNLEADWKSNKTDVKNIEFILNDDTSSLFDIDYNEESSYSRMISNCVQNLSNEGFWSYHYLIDEWILKQIENL